MLLVCNILNALLGKRCVINQHTPSEARRFTAGERSEPAAVLYYILRLSGFEVTLRVTRNPEGVKFSRPGGSERTGGPLTSRDATRLSGVEPGDRPRFTRSAVVQRPPVDVRYRSLLLADISRAGRELNRVETCSLTSFAARDSPGSTPSCRFTHRFVVTRRFVARAGRELNPRPSG